MTSEVKNNYAYVIAQDICNKSLNQTFEWDIRFHSQIVYSNIRLPCLLLIRSGLSSMLFWSTSNSENTNHYFLRINHSNCSLTDKTIRQTRFARVGFIVYVLMYWFLFLVSKISVWKITYFYYFRFWEFGVSSLIDSNNLFPFLELYLECSAHPETNSESMNPDF